MAVVIVLAAIVLLLFIIALEVVPRSCGRTSGARRAARASTTRP